MSESIIPKPPPPRVRDAIDAHLRAPPYNLPALQVIDMAAWLCGLEEGMAQSLLELSDGDAAFVWGRLEAESNPQVLIAAWIEGRYAQYAARSRADDVGKKWLR